MAFKQRRFRTKNEAEDNDAAPAPPPPPPPPAPAVNKPLLSAPKRTSKPSMLSFEDDEDGGDAAGSRDAASKSKSTRGGSSGGTFGRAKGLPDLPSASAKAQQPSTAGVYTTEGLKELQKNAISFSAASFAAAAQQQPGISVAAAASSGPAPLIKLSGSFKPAAAAKDDRFQTDIPAVNPPPILHQAFSAKASAKQQPTSASAGRSRDMPLPPPARPGTSSAAGGTTAASVEDDADGDDDFQVPDEDMIRMAKAKRERLRQAHLAPDYVSILGPSALTTLAAGGGTGAGGEAGGGTGGTGRADESGSEDETDVQMAAMRIRFGGGSEASGATITSKAVTTSSRHVRSGGGGVLSTSTLVSTTAAVGVPGADEEEDDAHEAFASAQLRKAIGRSAAGISGRGGRAGDDDGMGGARRAGAAGWGGGTAASAAAAGQAAVAAIQAGLQRTQGASKYAAQQLSRTEENLRTSLAKITTLKTDMEAAKAKYKAVQDFRAYIADLCDCLQEKSVLAEGLQDELQDMMEGRAVRRAERATVSAAEALKLAEAGVTAAAQVLARGGASAAAAAAAQNAVLEVEDDLLGTYLPVVLDETGRNVNLEVKWHAEQRAKHRAARTAADAAAARALAAGDGMALVDSDDEEDEEEARHYAHRHQEVLESCSTVFADTAEEFASVKAAKLRLEQWKYSFPKEYANTYMSLSTPLLFATYVRLELLRWDPLFGGGTDAAKTALGTAGSSNGGGGTGQQNDGKAASLSVDDRFDHHEWYEQLFDYGMAPPAAGGGTAAPADEDGDGDLVPQLVQKLVLPRALHMIERCWDATSIAQSRAAAKLVADVLVYVAAEEPRMVDLMHAVGAVLQAAADKATVPAWPLAAASAATTAEAVQFRCFRRAVRLLHSVAAFKELLPRPLLHKLALTTLVCGQLMPHLRAASGNPAVAVSRSEAVVEALPAEWSAGGPLREAAQLCDFLRALASTVELQRSLPGQAPLARRLAKALTRVGEAERAAQLLAAFKEKS